MVFSLAGLQAKANVLCSASKPVDSAVFFPITNTFDM